mmetsp:Transcript_5346/g.10200  ORF Transcript_5346/g.10200 Transcript_5346/m.10200 type:complete len:1566 (+) Transcript_5346:442-5139(+)
MSWYNHNQKEPPNDSEASSSSSGSHSSSFEKSVRRRRPRHDDGGPTGTGTGVLGSISLPSASFFSQGKSRWGTVTASNTTKQYSNNERGSSLVPIWALAHNSKIDHTTKATGVSSATASFSNHSRHDNFGMFRGGTSANSNTTRFANRFYTQQQQQQQMESCFDSSNRSWIASNATISKDGAAVANKTSDEAVVDSIPNFNAGLRNKSRSNDGTSDEINAKNVKKTRQLKRYSDNHLSKDDAVSEYNGTKTWVRSGNNWVMTDSTSRFRFMNDRQIDLDASSNNQNKRNPTAVSSYGTSSGGFAQTTSSMAMPHQAVSASNFLEYRPNQTAANDTISAISSYTPSSTYGLYTRQRLTKTADGFPYMPSLHLVPKKGSTASGGISGTTGISGPLSSNASLSDHRRFQRSYLLNAKPVSNQSSAFQLQQIDAFVEKKDSKNSEASLLLQASSGYDSEREQRLKEWKEKFVKKFIRAEPLVKDSPNRKNSSTRSLESDNIESDIVNRVTHFENRKEEKHDQRLPTASNVTLKDNKLDGRKHLVGESGYDPTNYTIRMKQWREQQYKDYGIPFRGSKKQVDSFEGVQVDGCDSDSQSYDSDSSRKRRLQEWKEQFACVDNTIRHTDHFEGLSPRTLPLRFSSLSAETGATNNDGADEEVGRDDINEKGVSVPSPSSRRGRDIPGGGIFPITSPHRKRNERSNNLNRMIPPQAVTDDFLLSPANSSKVSDYLTTPKRANTSPSTENSKSNSFTTKNEKEVHVVAKAAKFLLGFAPQLSSDDGIITPSGDCFMNALDINSPCQGLPSFPSDSMLENNKERSFGTGDLEYSQDLESETLFDNFAPIGTSLFANELKSKIPSWDNCLYVKSEGARSGRICITATHLVFIYEDDVSDALLERYGWNRDQIDELLLEMDNSPSRGATPVNVPLNESGEGEGIELIGSDGTNLSFMKLLEDGFSNSYDRQPGHDKKLSGRQTDTSLSDSRILTPKSSSLPIGTLDESIDAKNVDLYKVESHKSAADRFQPISASSSSLDESLSRDVPNHFVQRSESGENTLSLGSNEFVIDRCIIRACNEEASMRLHQDHSSVGKDNSFKPISDNEVIHDDEVLNENQTALSCYSEFDSCIDPDEERALYISGDNAKQSYIGIKWPLRNLGEIYDRRYMMKEVGVEIFSPSPTCTKANQQNEDNEIPLGPLGQLSLYLVIPGFDDRQYNFRRRKTPRRVTFIETLKVYAPHVSDYYWMSAPRLQRRWDWKKLSHDKSLEALTCAWTDGRISNYDYLLRLNAIAGRSFHDPGNYPVMPWVLSNYTSLSVPDLCDERNFRDLSKPMGALCPKRLRKFQDKYASLCYLTDTAIPPFMYGSHYSSTGGVVLHYLVRTRPFAGLHRQLQGGQFDLSDRLFRSIPQTWDMCSRTSTTEVKELTPEWYSNPLFLKNVHNFDLGICSVDGAPISDVVLPPWANNDPTKFIEIMQNALESDFCSSHLSKWIDLIFGYKQRGPEAEKANNIFYHLSYYDSYDLAKIDDEILRTEIELHIADFGSCPTQLFFQPHPSKTTCVKNKSEMNFAHEHFEG